MPVTSTVRSGLNRMLATLRNDTPSTWSPQPCTRAVTVPSGVSMATSTGRGPATAPVSTNIVAMAMVACPQPPGLQNGAKNTTPVTDPAATGGVSNAPN